VEGGKPQGYVDLSRLANAAMDKLGHIPKFDFWEEDAEMVDLIGPDPNRLSFWRYSRQAAAMKKFSSMLVLSAVMTLAGCAASRVNPASSIPHSMPKMAPISRALDDVAASYVRLTLEAGTHEAEYVDAYFGPPEIKALADARPRAKSQLIIDARALIAKIDQLIAEDHPSIAKGENGLRARALRGMVIAAETRLQMLEGRKYPFDAEANGQFATVPQLKPLNHYDGILAGLEKLMPGSGSLAARVDAFNERYVIPKDRLKPVFAAAIAECRNRTAAHIALPETESFVMEFVTGKPWSGYNYYQGNYKSLIQINTDLPIRISRAVDLGCHEGYPGHHVLNLMIESKLARGKAWKEFEVNPLYSPQSVLSEGSANYGIDLAFSPTQRLQFERDVLYPLAGLDPANAEAFWTLQQATEALSGARLTIAKMYLDGEVTRAAALTLTEKYLLLSPARAEQSVSFTDHYRSYVINYGWGKDLVRGFIERGTPDVNERWRRMEAILSTPMLPSDLQ
jgi:hypothetical protein